MARYKHYDYGQMKMLPVSFERQILPGIFEHTLHHPIDEEFDLSVFEVRYKNDDTGAPAYDPAILLKIILLAYARGITSSREIAGLCRENVVFMAVSADTAPHFTTIAGFVSSLEIEIVSVFRDVLLVCHEAGLIGREMFAVDGVKMPSNASKEWSGTRADFAKKAQKIERAIRYLVQRYRAAGQTGEDPAIGHARERQIKTLRAAVKKVKRFLDDNDDKTGTSGNIKKSNITDNQSAKMKTGHGVIQGHDGVAVVDAKRQIVVHAQAFGEAQEHGLLIPMLEGTRRRFRDIGAKRDVLKRAKLTADAGFHGENNSAICTRTTSTGIWPTPASGSVTCVLPVQGATSPRARTSRGHGPTRRVCTPRAISGLPRTSATPSVRRASACIATAGTAALASEKRSSSPAPNATAAPAGSASAACATWSAPRCGR